MPRRRSLPGFSGRKPLRVVIYAALQPGEAGGIEQATASLIAALGQLTDGDEQYIAITDETAADWLDPYLGSNTQVVVRTGPQRPPLLSADLARRGARKIVRTGRALYRRLTEPSECNYDLFVERLHPDVIHFPYQWFQETSAPSLYNPWDIQHVHFPQFFTPDELQLRTAAYAYACHRATAIEVASDHTRRDLVDLLDVPRSEVYVVPRPAPTSVLGTVDAATVSAVRSRYGLPPRFAYYPAQTWPHKNHIALIRAVAALRDRGHIIHLVFSGRQNEFWTTIEDEIERLGVQSQITALGYVSQEEVRSLYRLAVFTVFPSLFEGYGLPAQEALTEGSPLACSDLPVLVERAGDGADYFDPTSVDQLADSLMRLDCNPDYRDLLRRRGTKISASYSWRLTALTLRALYRELAGASVGPPDSCLLARAAGDAALEHCT